MDYKFVPLVTLSRKLDQRERNKRRAPRGRYMAFDPMRRRFLCADNSTGDFWVEEFESHEEASRWLSGGSEKEID